ncbi:MAG: DUF2807 domain-containing protein [Pseudomonadota bacterium]
MRRLSSLLSVLLLGACAQEAQDALETRALRVIGCEQVQIAGPLRVRLEHGEPAGLEATGTRAQIDALTLTQDQPGELQLQGAQPGLELRLRCPRLASLRLLGKAEVRDGARTEQPAWQLERVSAYGDSRLSLSRVQGGVLEARAAGQAQVHLDDVLADEMLLRIAGSARMVASGDVNDMRVDGLGQSQLQAAELRAQNVTLQLGGRSAVVVAVSAHLDGEVAADASYEVRGSPDRSVVRLPAKS